MIRFDPTLLDLTSNFFALCTNMEVYLYNYSKWMKLSMNIHGLSIVYDKMIFLK